jgi:iron complex transport system ATP-binding protein
MVSLALQDIGASYGKIRVLDGISASLIAGGGLTAVIGPNAAGKSTFFKRVAGLIKGSGRVEILEGKSSGDTICYMPQDTDANAVLTVYESVLLASRKGAGWRVPQADLESIDKLLDSLRISQLAFRSLGELSGGQRQLVAVAQALARSPEILLMDEPTSALDLHRQVEVMQFMQDLARRKNMAVLIAIHDLNHALRYCDQTLVLANGRLVASGPSGDVITTAMLRDIYQVEARIETCSQGWPQVIVDGGL